MVPPLTPGLSLVEPGYGPSRLNSVLPRLEKVALQGPALPWLR